VRSCTDFLVRLNPEPHRRTFRKKGMREEKKKKGGEILGEEKEGEGKGPVNHYRGGFLLHSY